MRKLIAATIVASQVAACGSQTTYRLRSGYEVEGDVAGRIDNTIYLRTDQGRRTIDACDVVDVSYPGKATAITGTALLGVGTLIAVITLGAWSSTRGNNSDVVLAVGAVYGLPFLATGGALAGFGYSHWNDASNKTGELPAHDCAHQDEPNDGGYAPYEAESPASYDAQPVRPGVTPVLPHE